MADPAAPDHTVLVLGGAGIFGGRISAALAAENGLRVTVAGRNVARGTGIAAELGATFVACDLNRAGALRRCLAESEVDLLVHAAGPFQGYRYDVAETCIEAGVHYLDIADARAFVCGIGALDARARAAGVFVGSGASSVPTITHALVSALTPGFGRVDAIQIALSPGNQNPRGASTLGAVLSYVGREHRVRVDGAWSSRTGWSDARRLAFPSSVGTRSVYACDVPDLELFPDAFGARTVRFHAGLELGVLNGVLTCLRHLRQRRLLPDLRRCGTLARRLSLLLFPFGSKNGALAVWVRGDSPAGRSIERRIALVTDDDGPATPSSPAILLAHKLLLGAGLPPGARPCMGLLDLDEILAHLRPKGIWCARGTDDGRWREV